MGLPEAEALELGGLELQGGRDCQLGAGAHLDFHPIGAEVAVELIDESRDRCRIACIASAHVWGGNQNARTRSRCVTRKRDRLLDRCGTIVDAREHVAV